MKYQLPLLFFLVVPFLLTVAQDNEKSLSQQADEAYDNRDYEKAIRLYKEIYKIPPQNFKVESFNT